MGKPGTFFGLKLKRLLSQFLLWRSQQPRDLLLWDDDGTDIWGPE